MLNGYNSAIVYPLISVVIPVYKTEKYLYQCVDSVLNQTYQNLEIILIDDGSPDNCGSICDTYKEKDSRVLVIHKENGGQSSARNAAIKIVTGEYISFVDSDDYIDSDMIMNLYLSLVKTKSQIAICGFTKHYQEGRIELDNSFNEEKVFHGDEILNVFLSDELIGSQPCNKLFARYLFEGVVFPIGRVYEDIAVMHIVFSKADTIVCLPSEMYNYIIHEESTSFQMNSRWAFGLFRAFADRYEFMLSICLERNIKTTVMNLILSKACGFSIAGFNYWNATKETDSKYINNAVAFLRTHIAKILVNPIVTNKRKLKALIICLFPGLFIKLTKKGFRSNG